MRDIGKNIKQLRIAQEMTQDQLAERLFVTRQTVSNYENGKSHPDVDMLIQIAQVLDTDVNALIYGPPVTVSRKTQKKLVIVSLILSAALGGFLLLLTLATWTEPWRGTVLKTGMLPCCYAIWGFTVMALIGYFLQVKLLQGTAVTIFRWILLGIMAVYLLWAIPYCLWSLYCLIGATVTESFSSSFGFMRHVGAVFEKLQHAGYGPVFLFPGAALWLLGFPPVRR